MNEGYVMNEAHVYIGCNRYPAHRGRETVAPGQYNFNPSGDLDYVSNYTVGPIAASGPLYVIVHAVTCEVVCQCSVSENEGGSYTPNDGVECNEQDSSSHGGFVPGMSSFSNFGFRTYQTVNTNTLNVNYELDIDSDVTVEVLNMRGIILKREIKQNYKAGTDETMQIDMSDESDHILFVRMTTKSGVDIKKIIMKKN